MSKINVIDAPCGTGKTSWAIQTINENKDKSYIYCTPFLDEITRIKEACGKDRFAEPTNNGFTKIENFNLLLSLGMDIAVTHTTFLNATSETLELIRTGDYTIIIDEALDVVMDFNKIQTVEDTPKQKVSKSDIKLLLDRDIIQIEKNNRVVWCGGEYDSDCKFSEVQRLAKLKRLYCVDNQFMIAIFPPEMFDCFSKVYIMTYMFGGSTFKYYLDLFNIEYDLKSVAPQGFNYELINYAATNDKAFRLKCKNLITVCDNENMNNTKSNSLSRAWYDNSKDNDRLMVLKRNISNYFKNIVNAKASDGSIMWTCYGAYENAVKGKGYICERKLTDKEKSLPQDEREALEKELSCFVPCNAKATNIYRKRWALAYCVNMYFNPMMRKFFTDSNDDRSRKGLQKVSPNEDLYALSCMLQWIFRSRIRDNKPISIYIPNRRMRNLLFAWMDDKI